jgi:flagellin
MRIQHNIMAMNAYRNYSTNTSSLSKNLEKLSSGYKINRAGDDAAGLAISEKMRAQISGLEQASSNVKDGISLVQTGEGALQEVQDMLNRMVTLATQSANGTYDETTDRVNLQKEVTALKDEIDRIADSANFNGINLLDGTQSLSTNTVDSFGIGSTSRAQITMSISSTAGSISGKDFIGGKIIIGKHTYSLIAGTGAASTVAVTSNKTAIKVGKAATSTAILAAAWSSLTSSEQTITVQDINGQSFDLEGKYSQGAITFQATSSAAGKQIDATYLPELKINAGMNLQIGDTARTYNQMNVGISDMHCKTLYIDNIDISTQEGATNAISQVKNAINMVSSTRGDLGAIQNRLEHTANNLSVMTENIQDAESTIRDTDIAEEMTSYTKNNILIQSAQAMLAQANSVPQGVLQLLQ